MLLTLHRREDLLATWPNELGDDLDRLNDGISEAMTDFVQRHFGGVAAEDVDTAKFALIDILYAAVRSILRSRQSAARLTDTAIAAACAALDRSGQREEAVVTG